MIKPRTLKSGVGFQHFPNGDVQIYRMYGDKISGTFLSVEIPKGNILSAYIYLGRVLRSKK